MNKIQIFILLTVLILVGVISQNTEESSPTKSQKNIQEQTIPPEKRLEHGELIKKNVNYFKNIYGHHKLTIDNSQGGSDAIAKLVPTNQSAAIISVYIREGYEYTIDEIPNGSYELFFAYVGGYDYTTGNLLGLKGTQKSDDILEFHETRENYSGGYSLISSHITITLYTISNGNLTTSSIPNDTFNGF